MNWSPINKNLQHTKNSSKSEMLTLLTIQNVSLVLTLVKLTIDIMTYKQTKCNRIDFVIGRKAEIEMARAENELPAIEMRCVGAFPIFR